MTVAWDVLVVWSTGSFHVLAALWAGGHILLKRREPTAAILWLLVVALVPVLGPVLYALMGLHRVARKHALRGRRRADMRTRHASLALLESRRKQFMARAPQGVQTLTQAVGRISGRSLLMGNRLQPLVNGEEAFPRMLEAIAAAKHSVHLLTYIMDDDDVAHAFMDALQQAAERGVKVRLLYDAIGASDLEASFFGPVRRAGVQVAESRPLELWRWQRGLHFRNHRKVLVVDGLQAFTGGMNISARHYAQRLKHPLRCMDVHFFVKGPVVMQLQEVFLEDWHDATGEVLLDDAYFPDMPTAGSALARVITSSPAGDEERLLSTFFQALGCAQHRVQVATPYFLPGPAIMQAFKAAVQRGVHVDVVLPGVVDSEFVRRAMMGTLPEVVACGVNVFIREPPFSHAKVMVVDGAWATIGSANWDPRSLKYNDECNLEVMDGELVAALESWFERERAVSQRLTAWQWASRPLVSRLVDRAAALFTPTL